MPITEAEKLAEREALKYALDPQTEERVVFKLCKEFDLQPVEYDSLDKIVFLLKTWRLKAVAHETHCEKLSSPAAVPIPPASAFRGGPLHTDHERASYAAADKVFGPQMKVREVFDLLVANGDLEAPSALDILIVCVDLSMFLMGKNRKYGDSALAPLNILSNASPLEKIKVRMEDKLKRLVYGKAADEDTLLDLVGYWVLMRVAERRLFGQLQGGSEAYREAQKLETRSAKENGT